MPYCYVKRPTIYLSVYLSYVYVSTEQGTYIIKEQYQSALPAAPSKLRVSDVADTSVHLTWNSQEMGQSPVAAYVVEYFSPQTPQVRLPGLPIWITYLD